MIAGLEAPTAGRIFIAGRDVTELAASERDVSMVFQSYALFPHMDVLANVGYGLTVSGVPRDAGPGARAGGDGHRSASSAWTARMPSELSGGQQQRVALARALVLEPSVLLFDEPLSNLDARLRRSMREEIRGLQQRLGLTVAYVTHDQAEAMAVSDRIIVMDRGRIAQAGTPHELYERPRSEFVAGFMGEAMLFDGPGAGRRPRAPRADHAGGAGCRGGRAGQGGGASRGLAGAAGRRRRACGHRRQGRLSRQRLRVRTFDTELGPIFVVAPVAGAAWKPGDTVSLRLGGHGFSVIAA